MINSSGEVRTELLPAGSSISYESGSTAGTVSSLRLRDNQFIMSPLMEHDLRRAHVMRREGERRAVAEGHAARRWTCARVPRDVYLPVVRRGVAAGVEPVASAEGRSAR